MSGAKYSFCLLLVVANFFSTESIAAGQGLRVLTFNIRYGTARDEGHTWDLRKDAVVKLIQKSSADFVGLQESLDFQNDYILSKVDAPYVLVGEGREGGTRGEFAPVLFDSQKYTLIRAGRFWLSETPEVVGSKSWSDLPRVVSWIEVISRSSSMKFLVLNTHFSHVSDEARDRGARLILEKVMEIAPSKETGILLMGDFNCPPGSGPHQTLVQPKGIFLDTQSATGSPEQRTFNGFREPLTREGQPIDWVLFSGPLSAESYQVLTQKVDDVIPSDHFPVLTTFSIE